MCLGFCITFSALFSKTWRINRVFQSKDKFVKVKVTERDVMIPFVILLSLNVLVLSLWSALAPLKYVRLPHPGTDDWNRVISTYGVCQSETDRIGGAVPYMVILGAIILGVIVMANVQAYQARGIQSEFSESKYIALVMVSFLQSICTGAPVLFLVNDNPQAYYLIMVFMIFLTCMAVLLLIFIPKFMFARMYSEERVVDDKKRGSVPSAAFFEKPLSQVRRGSSSVSEKSRSENFSKGNITAPTMRRSVSLDERDLGSAKKSHLNKNSSCAKGNSHDHMMQQGVSLDEGGSGRSCNSRFEKISENADISEEEKGSGDFVSNHDELQYSEYYLDQVTEEDMESPMENDERHSLDGHGAA
jgi:hypothetical protein